MEPLKGNNPKVSIGLPVYNGEKFLKETLDSFLSQTYRDFELIISDNASTDRTAEICQEYASKDSRIKFYRNDKNIGASRNYNRVFELSRGQYFKWAAADDLCAPDFIRKCVKILDNEPDIILSYPRTVIINEEGRFLGKYDNNLYLKADSPSGRFLQFFYNAGLATAVFGVSRQEVFKKTRLHGHYLHSDLVLLGELSLLGKFKEIPDYLYFKRLHRDSYMGSLMIDGSIVATKDQQRQYEFFDPNAKNAILMPSWRLFYEHLSSIKRSPISFLAKTNLSFFLFGSLLINYKCYGREIKIAIKRLLLRDSKR